MVNTFFHKRSSVAKTPCGAVTRSSKSGIKSEIIPDQQLAKELHKSIIWKFKKCKAYSYKTIFGVLILWIFNS